MSNPAFNQQEKQMWDDDDFEVHDGPPGKGYMAAVIVGAIAVIVSILFNS